MLLAFAAIPLWSQTCTFTLSPTSGSFSSSSTNSIVSINASASACPWVAQSNTSWITVSFGQSGNGNGSAGFTVAANNTPSIRTGSLSIASISFTVTQAAAACGYTLAPTAANVGPSGGSGTINVSSICPWTAVSNSSDWLTVSGSATSSGVAQYVAAANGTSANRSGTISIGTSTFTVTQAGTCSYNLNPSGIQADANNGSTGTFTVTPNSSSCAWSAVSQNADFITVTSGGSGTGNGTVGYAIAPNRTMNARSGVISVGGVTSFSVYQPAGAACSYGLAPASATYNSGGGASSFAITTTCSWTATSNASWINLGGVSSGTGAGTVVYNVVANTTSSSRTGAIVVGGQSFTITQSGVACTVMVTPASVQSASSGSTGKLQVDAPDGCAWTSSANANWISLGAAGGTGTGTVPYVIGANTTSKARTASITISNQVVPVSEDATICTETLTPASASVPSTSGNYGFHLDTNCGYTAVASSGWVRVTSGAVGNGPADIAYAVAANTTADARTASISLGSQTFTVSQSGAGCTLVLGPAAADVAAVGGTGSFNVTASGNCRWQANANAAWVHLSYAAVNGNGRVNYSADANTGPSVRTAQVMVGDQIFALRQGGQTAQISSAGVLNSASFVTGPVAPGEIITLFGTGIGPVGGASLEINAEQQSLTTALAGTVVLFDGIAAPLIYVSDGQVSTIVPYALSGQSSTKLQVTYQGSTSNTVTLNVAPSSPALFTLDASGSGAGAILNQDTSLNSATNPASKGSVIVLFATGEGQTNPAGVDGLLANGSRLPKPVGAVSVQIGGVNATVQYAGAAPGLTAGLMQVNVVVPASVIAGSVPVVLRVGTAASPATVTAFVR